MDWLLPARKAKHAGFVARKKARRAYVDARDLAFTCYDRVVPHHFDPNRHRNSWGEYPRMYFLHRDPPRGARDDLATPRRIYAVWTGDNPLTPNRRRGLDSLRAVNPEIPVIVVTPENLHEVTVPGAPIHPAYERLSLVHRSDYLRAYLMHHHGGGYSDIKVANHEWSPAFDDIDRNPELWAVGYRELGSDRCGGRDARLGHEIRRRYRSLIGFGAFVCRPGTALTGEWLRELTRRLDYYAEELAEHPGDTWGENARYPIRLITVEGVAVV